MAWRTWGRVIEFGLSGIRFWMQTKNINVRRVNVGVTTLCGAVMEWRRQIGVTKIVGQKTSYRGLAVSQIRLLCVLMMTADSTGFMCLYRMLRR